MLFLYLRSNRFYFILQIKLLFKVRNELFMSIINIFLYVNIINSFILNVYHCFYTITYVNMHVATNDCNISLPWPSWSTIVSGASVTLVKVIYCLCIIISDDLTLSWADRTLYSIIALIYYLYITAQCLLDLSICYRMAFLYY